MDKTMRRIIQSAGVAWILLALVTIYHNWDASAGDGLRSMANDLSFLSSNNWTNGVKPDGYLVSTNAHFYIQAAKEFGVLTNLVNELVTSGEVCRVRGHLWQHPPYIYANENAFNMERRECAVCKQMETRSMPAWPTP